MLVIDDSEDDDIAGVCARENMAPSDSYSGVWRSGERDGSYLADFHLVELGGGLERRWVTDNIHRPLLEAIVTVPHLVAIMPDEIAGTANTAEDLLPRLAGSLLVEVQQAAPQVERMLAERDD